jgi:hypothetical protein
MRAARSAARIIALLALTASAQARDAAPLPQLDWQAPRDCPDGEAVAARLRDVLDGELLAFGRDWQINGRMSADGARPWRLVLELRESHAAPGSPPRVRVLHAAQCDDLAEAAAVAIALALGDAMAPEARQSDALTRAEPDEDIVHAGALAPSDAPPLAQTAEGGTPARASLELSLGALLDSASLGGWAVGGSVAARAWLERLGLGVYGLWLPPNEQAIAPGQGADFSLLGGGVRACYAPLDPHALRLAACAGFELGRFTANSHGLRASARLHDLWSAPTLGADLQGRLLGPLALDSRFELLWPLERQEYRVDLAQPVHDVPAVTFRWVVGVSGALPL